MCIEISCSMCEHDMNQFFLLLLHWQCPCSSVSHHVNEPNRAFPHTCYSHC